MVRCIWGWNAQNGWTGVDPGYYYLVVDGRDATAVGSFQMQVTFYPGFGTECDQRVRIARQR